MEVPFKMPLYAKSAFIFICIFSFVFVMYIGQDIIIPIAYATIFAILLNPFVNFLLRKKVSKIMAITITVTLVLLAVVAIFYIFYSGVTVFAESFPQFKIRFDQTIDRLVKWASQEFGYKPSKINKWISDTQTKAI